MFQFSHVLCTVPLVVVFKEQLTCKVFILLNEAAPWVKTNGDTKNHYACVKNGVLNYAALSLLSPFLILSNRVVAALKSSSASDSMPRCCSCNSSGRCLRCACVHGGRNCDNCAPLYQNCCSNQPRNSSGSQTAMAKNHSPQSLEVILVATEAYSASSPTDAVGPPDAFAHSVIVTPVQDPIASPIIELSAPLSPPELSPYPLLFQPAFTWG